MGPLTMNYLRKGESARVLHVYAQAEQKKHLTSIGFIPGAVIQIISTNQEEMIIKLKGSRLGVTKDLTQIVTVDRIRFDEADLKALSQVPVGDSVKVVKVAGEPAFRKRIMDMGITKNAKIRVVKYAPLGDPMEIQVRGYQLSLRKSEADLVQTIAEGGAEND